MATIIIPTPLRKFTDNQAKITVSGNTIIEAIKDLKNSHPDILEHLLNDDLSLKGFIRIYIGEEDINEHQGINSKVNETDIISIIPAIAGGLN